MQSNLIIRDVIRDLNSEEVTVFLTTHNIEEANLICDRVAIINKGRIAAIDAPEKLKGTIQSVQSVEVAFDRTSPELAEEMARLARVSEVGRREISSGYSARTPHWSSPAHRIRERTAAISSA